MSKFTFSEYDLANSLIVPDEEDSLSFSLATERGPMSGNISSVLTVSDADGNRTTGATIDWKKRSMDIMGVTKAFVDIKNKPGGMLSSTREWKWSGKKYTTSLYNGSWTIKSGRDVFATLQPVILHTFGRDEPATLTFHKSLPIEETVFIIFAITFIILQGSPPDKQPKTVKAAVGGFALGLAIDVACGAVFSSCSIQ